MHLHTGSFLQTSGKSPDQRLCSASDHSEILIDWRHGSSGQKDAKISEGDHRNQ